MRYLFTLKALWLLLLSASFSLLAQNTLPEAHGGAGGLWLPVNLPAQHHANMSEMGLEISPEMLYSATENEISDAVVVLNGGMCTAEAVSEQGLLFTNHHCAFDAVAIVSTEEDDKLTNGFWATNLEEEVPLEGMTAGFLIRQENVTAQVLGETGEATPAEIASRTQEIEAAAAAGNYEASVQSVLNGNAYYLFVYQTFRDVRLAGIPPVAIGKYGFDQDNFEWPRHTGDFAVLRVYADADNQPADYSEDNVPFQPTYHLPISLEGIEEGDFQMSYGYPGSTDRYLTTSAIDARLNVINPTRIRLTDQTALLMDAAMEASSSQRIVLEEHFASLMNALKFFKGEIEMSGRYDILAKKKAEEAKFQQWVAADPDREEKYGDLLEEIGEIVERQEASAVFREALIYGVLHPDIAPQALGFGYGPMRQLLAAMGQGPDATEQVAGAVKAGSQDYFEGLIPALDKEIFAQHFLAMHDMLPEEMHPEIFAEIATGIVPEPQPLQLEEPEEKPRKKKKRKKKKRKKKKGQSEESILAAKLQEIAQMDLEGRVRNWTETAYSQSILTSEDRLNAFLEAPDGQRLSDDPLMRFVNGMFGQYVGKYAQTYQGLGFQLNNKRKDYIKALMEMHPEAQFYPNANSTMRTAYGTVKRYEPKDGIIYDYYTTLAGAIEKEQANPGDKDFFVPARLKELYEAKDYGRYGTDGQLVTCYINTLDNTGGGSGSPSMNAKGELTGLLFDGNWEGMTGDIYVFPEYARSIVVDIRYVLFIIDKYADCQHIMEELTIR